MAAISPVYCCSTSERILGAHQPPISLHSLPKLFRSLPFSNRKCSLKSFNFSSPFSDLSIDSIPKKFHPNNLGDDVLENFRNTPRHLYGLPSSQLALFADEDSAIRRKLDGMAEGAFMSSPSIINQQGGSIKSRGASLQSVEMFFKRRRKNRKKPAPDLPSSLLRSRICYLGMPVFPAVSELIIAQLMYLDSSDNTKPIHFYINSTGTLDDNRQLVALENDAYAIADAMALCRAPIHTINCGVADGQAAMLLSLGTKGKRTTQPNASVQLYLPKAENLSGSASDMWIQAREVDVNTEYYVELLAKGTGKTAEEVLEDIALPRHMSAEEAIAYGIVDSVVEKMPAYEKPVPKRVRVRSRGKMTGNGVATRPPLEGVSVRPPARVARSVKPPAFVRMAKAAAQDNNK